MKMSKFVAALVIALGVLFSGLSSFAAEHSTRSLQAPARSLVDLDSTELELIDSLNQFAFELFQKVSTQALSGDNVFISPLSISYALALCYNGATGKTKSQIGAALHLPDWPDDQLNRAFREVVRILQLADTMVQFSTANSLWSREGKAIVPSYEKMAREYFDARVEEIDFQAPETPGIINAWVEEATDGKITDLISPPIDPSIASLLLNAIYFKGGWTLPFDPEKTKEATFYLADGTEKICQMMHMPNDDHLESTPEGGVRFDPRATWFSYGEYLSSFNLTGVSLPFGDGNFRMTVIDAGIDYTVPTIKVDQVIDSLNLVNWLNWVESGEPVKFELFMPKFKFKSVTPLNETLAILGIEAAFNPSHADFGDMFQDGTGWISEAKQKAFIKVDEKGAVAAALTLVFIADSVPPNTHVNSPFVIVIHEDISGAILFMGRISDPLWED